MKWNNKGHQFDMLGNCFRKRNKLYIYGAAEVGKNFFEILQRANLSEMVDGFIDKDLVKQENGFLGKKVLSPDILFESHEEYHVIIVAILDHRINQVLERLKKAGYVAHLEFFHWREFLIGLNDVYLPVYALYTQNKLIVSSSCTIPSNVCNLRCKHCLNFTPYIKKFEARALEELYQDIDLFFKWIDFTFRFQISGGEPLLYPKLNELINYIGNNYRNQIDVFETVLNGTLIPSDEICQSMKEHNMTVYLDNYVSELPESLNCRTEIIEQLEKYEICWIDNTVEEWFDLDIFHTDNSQMSEGELTEYFDNCNNPWHYYENGKIYTCNFARFAMKAGLNEELKSGYFDLKEMSKDRKTELLEFLLNYNELGYAQLCKKCAGWADMNPNKVPVAVQCEV